MSKYDERKDEANHHSQGQAAELLGIKFHHQWQILWIWYYPKQNGGVESILEVRGNTFSKLLWVWFIFLKTILIVLLILKCMISYSQLRSYLQLTNAYIAKNILLSSGVTLGILKVLSVGPTLISRWTTTTNTMVFL